MNPETMHDTNTIVVFTDGERLAAIRARDETTRFMDHTISIRVPLTEAQWDELVNGPVGADYETFWTPQQKAAMDALFDAFDAEIDTDVSEGDSED